MPTNNISVTQLTANLALAAFENNNSLLLTGARDYQSQFALSSFRVGDTVNIRNQNHFIPNDSRIKTPQSVDEVTTPLTISHNPGLAVEFTAQEYTLSVDTEIERYNERYVEPAVQAMIKQAEGLIYQSALTELNFMAGTPGAPINSFSIIDLAGAKMEEQAMPMSQNAYMALNVRQASALRSSLQNAFNPTLNEDISFNSALGHLSFFDIYSNQSIGRHTAGSSAGAPQTSAAVTSGTVIPFDLATASQTGVYKAGDVITIAGVNSVNPIDRSDTGQPMQFVVQADVDSDGAGAGEISVLPAIISDPANPRRNVSIAIPNNALITLAGAGSTYGVNLAYCTRGLQIAIPPMAPYNSKESYVMTSDKTGCSILVTLDSDTLNGLNYMRFEMLLGFKWMPQYAIKLASS